MALPILVTLMMVIHSSDVGSYKSHTTLTSHKIAFFIVTAVITLNPA
jgi:hypothetical protein